MPTYEYQCKSCEHRFEIWQKMTDEPLKICPECSGIIRRVFFPAGIVFKGSGFYKTDHGSGAVAGENNAHSSNDNKSETKEGTPKTESTSETKAESEKASPATPTSEKVAAAD